MTSGIYKFQNLITQEVYIGQSVDIQERYKHHQREWLNGTTKLYQAIQQYGWDNFSHEIVEYCSIDQLNERERYWIDYYDSWHNGYNHNRGGSNKNSIDRQQIYDLYDEGLEPKEIAIKLDIGLSTTYQILNTYEPFVNKQEGNSDKFVIYQYSLTGEFIKKWSSCKEVQRELGISACSIGKVISGKRNSAGGYIWSKNPNLILQEKIQTSLPKTIYQYSLTGEYLAEFNSLAEASRAVSGYSSAIRRASNEGLNRSAYGYRWSFEKL